MEEFMKKLSLSLVICLTLASSVTGSEKLHCKKFTGTFKKWNITVLFNSKGKMEIHTIKGTGLGRFSSLGYYSFTGKEIGYFYSSRRRTILIKGGLIEATPYSFAISEDFSKKIILKEDSSFKKKCSKN